MRWRLEKVGFLTYLEGVINKTDDEMDSPAKERVFSRMTVKIPASITGWVVVIAFT